MHQMINISINVHTLWYLSLSITIHAGRQAGRRAGEQARKRAGERAREQELPVPVGKNTPREKKTHRKIDIRSINSGSGEQILLKDCKAKAHLKGMFFTDTGRKGNSDQDQGFERLSKQFRANYYYYYYHYYNYYHYYYVYTLICIFLYSCNIIVSTCDDLATLSEAWSRLHFRSPSASASNEIGNISSLSLYIYIYIYIHTYTLLYLSTYLDPN